MTHSGPIHVNKILVFVCIELSIREAAEEMIENARRCLELEMGAENVLWSKKSTSQNSVASQRIDPHTNIEAPNRRGSSQQLTGIASIQIDRKRKRDDGDADPTEYMNAGKRFGKARRTCEGQSDSESETETETECDFLSGAFNLVGINSAGDELNEDHQKDHIDKLIKYDNFQLVNVFQKIEFFKKFRETIANTPMVSLSVGVNQLPKRAPIIGLSSLVKQVHTESATVESYNCSFDDDKFIAVITICMNDNDVYYLNLQNEACDDAAITFEMKAKFLFDLFHMKQMTLVMYDAKEQCKVLLKCFPKIRSFCAQLRDPLVANWLLQPDVYGNLLTMASEDKVASIRFD